MGYKVKEAREEAGLTQEGLSIKSGISRTTISGLESGRVTTATTDTLTKIARALNKTVAEIFFAD